MDTIVALSTAPGRSAIGVVRLSGPCSLEIIRELVGDEDLTLIPNQCTVRALQPTGEANALDQAVVTYFAAPHSYTGEDVVEISCHGSPVILRQVIDRVLLLGGRLAEPGEFTLRALGNGKLNLSQAIAVRDLINARSDAAAKQAVRQLKGELSLRMQQSKERLIQAIVLLESSLEFVEDDLPEIESEKLRNNVLDIASSLSNLAGTFSVGHLLRDGLRVTIAGRPNVGKSSLFNYLVRSNRAIVTELPGTTRDSLTEAISIDGFPVVLTDTAGLRESPDEIEQLGVERSHQAIADADLVLMVVDGSCPTLSSDVDPTTPATPHLVVRNKSDLPTFKQHYDGGTRIIDVSAHTGAGIDRLRAAIIRFFGEFETSDSSLLITDARQHDLLRRAAAEVESSAEMLQEGRSEELVVIGLNNALRLIGEITGETTTDDILAEIFSTFCIGK
ncbi:MAG TPA: tRNA uridine-5-carboxymethylaminomethyl(34) synthesis GTPase MnmE [Pyrinomonadaceae bacterium]|nr:tRNA uridine-5-carboxymethylaminomethyl(34) synthesis GTPase MnmE [Pyrinomonadaceae bacterium]